MASGGVPGGAVAMIATGSLLIYSGIKNIPVLDAVRSLAAGRAPTPATPVTTPATAAAPAPPGTGRKPAPKPAPKPPPFVSA